MTSSTNVLSTVGHRDGVRLTRVCTMAGPLDAQVLDGLEHVHQPLSHHPLQQNVQSYELTTATNAIAAGREGRGQTTIQWSLW